MEYVLITISILTSILWGVFTLHILNMYRHWRKFKKQIPVEAKKITDAARNPDIKQIWGEEFAKEYIKEANQKVIELYRIYPNSFGEFIRAVQALKRGG